MDIDDLCDVEANAEEAIIDEVLIMIVKENPVLYDPNLGRSFKTSSTHHRRPHTFRLLINNKLKAVIKIL